MLLALSLMAGGSKYFCAFSMLLCCRSGNRRTLSLWENVKAEYMWSHPLKGRGLSSGKTTRLFSLLTFHHSIRVKFGQFAFESCNICLYSYSIHRKKNKSKTLPVGSLSVLVKAGFAFTGLAGQNFCILNFAARTSAKLGKQLKFKKW